MVMKFKPIQMTFFLFYVDAWGNYFIGKIYIHQATNTTVSFNFFDRRNTER